MLDYHARPVTLREVIPILVIVAVCIAALVWAIRNMMDLPTVYKSTVTGECLYVYDESRGSLRQKLPCDVLPERYETVWVAPFMHPVSGSGKH